MKLQTKIKALCFVDDQQGRDVEIIFPIVYFAEKILNIEVEFCFVWEIHAIYKKKPQLVIIPNIIGSKWYFEIAKYANSQGVKVFALISEGNFRENNTFNYWGYNVDKVFYQDYVCHWSQRTLDYLVSQEPSTSYKHVLTGGTGFDRYKIYDFMDKFSFLEKYEKTKYSKVITYAGWAFGKLYNETGRIEIINSHKENAESRIKWMKDQMNLVESILKELITNNPEILFVLKRHPNETHPHILKESRNEMNRLLDFDNVLYIRDNESIDNLVSVSDIWLGFETTTAIEAWLCDKVTILINPDPDFNRDMVFKGSLIAKTFNQLMLYINEYYMYGKVSEFESEYLKVNRERIIRETIGFSDGFNHIRCGNYLKKTVDSIDTDNLPYIFNIKFFLRNLALKVGAIVYNRGLFSKIPKLKKTIWIFDRYKLNNIYILKTKYYKYLDRFYDKNEILKSN